MSSAVKASEMTLNEKALLNPEHYKWRWFAGAFIGWLLDGQDFVVLALALPLMIKELNLSFANAGALVTVTLIGAAIGAYSWGPIADKLGRKKSLLLCLTWVGIFTVSTGLCSTYMQLLIVRFLCGLGLGGEMVISVAIVSEAFPPEVRARAGSAVQSAFPCGYFVALAVNYYLVSIYGWRVLFYSGSFVIFGILYAALYMPESVPWLRSQENLKKGVASISKATVDAVRWTDLFKGANTKTILLTMLLCISTHVSYWGANAWLPAYLLDARGIDLKTMSGYLILLNVTAFFGYYLFGWFADKTGRRWNFMVGGIASAIVVLLYMQAATPATTMYLGMLFGLVTFGHWGPQGAFVGEQFPTKLRATGLSFSYGAGRVFAAAAPMLVGGIGQSYGLGFALSLTAIFYALTAVAAYFMKETKKEIIVD